MDTCPSLLVVDQSEETREVLRSAFVPRGVRFLEAKAASTGLALAREHHPDLIVFDLESAPASPADVTGAMATPAPGERPQMVILGTARRQASAPVGSEFVAKPFHYAPLIRRIEELLGVVQPEERCR